MSQLAERRGAQCGGMVRLPVMALAAFAMLPAACAPVAPTAASPPQKPIAASAGDQVAKGSVTITAPPAALRLDPFYKQYLSADGIPIIASDQVPPEAVYAARSMMAGMLQHRPELGEVLARQGYRTAILAQAEELLDLPEFRDWKKPGRADPRLTRCERKHYEERIGRLSDKQYWNARARGMGGKHMAAAAEDILGQRTSRYFGETILVHEFAHNILFAIKASDPTLYRAVEAAYANAKANGLWLDEYNMTTIDEYWADGTQFWFNSNKLQAFEGRQILNHQNLIAYDPALAAVLRAAYGEHHRLAGDPFWMSEARVPPGPPPVNTAEVC